jgi:hypothetical protein
VCPSTGDLNTTNEIIGHHSVRNSAGTGTRLWLAGPARHFELGPLRRELGIY